MTDVFPVKFNVLLSKEHCQLKVENLKVRYRRVERLHNDKWIPKWEFVDSTDEKRVLGDAHGGFQWNTEEEAVKAGELVAEFVNLNGYFPNISVKYP
jgi:hypothetical protein